MTEELAGDGKALDYQDEEGLWWIMCACGHRCGGPEPGTKITMCPNCQFLLRFQSIDIVYPDRMPDGLRDD